MALDFQQTQGSKHNVDLPQQPLNDVPSQDKHALLAVLSRAELLIDVDEEAAAFMLDGLPHQIIGQWYARRQCVVPRADEVLADLEQRDEEVAWQLRHTLRAPEVQARLLHLRMLFQMVAS